MFRTITVISPLIVMLISVNALAQGVGTIILYSDAAGTSCNFADNPTGLVFVYVFHSFHNGVTGSQFKIQNSGTGFVWLGDGVQGNPAVIGTTNVGAWFAYGGGCVTTDFNFVNVLYDAQGTAAVCSSLEIVPAPAAFSGTIEGVDCAQARFVADGSILTVNCPDEGQCGGVVPVESTTWGRVKALYR